MAENEIDIAGLRTYLNSVSADISDVIAGVRENTEVLAQYSDLDSLDSMELCEVIATGGQSASDHFGSISEDNIPPHIERRLRAAILMIQKFPEHIGMMLSDLSTLFLAIEKLYKTRCLLPNGNMKRTMEGEEEEIAKIYRIIHEIGMAGISIYDRRHPETTKKSHVYASMYHFSNDLKYLRLALRDLDILTDQYETDLYQNERLIALFQRINENSHADIVRSYPFQCDSKLVEHVRNIFGIE